MSESIDTIMTGEAVAIEARPASVVTRAMATVIDLTVYLVIAFFVAILIGRFADIPNEAVGSTVVRMLLITVVMVVPTAVETATRGRSLGKIILGTRVVRDDGGPISFRHALTRWASGFVEIFLSFGMIAFTVATISQRSKRIGDVMAGTYVVRLTGTEERDLPILCPPELEAWAQNADMRSLPDRVGLYARKYLARTGTMSESARQRLGLQLAAEVEKYVAPRPPRGTHPERFLAAVLATRRDREYAVALTAQAADMEERAMLAALPHGIGDTDT